MTLHPALDFSPYFVLQIFLKKVLDKSNAIAYNIDILVT